jgi:hypothetical protein
VGTLRRVYIELFIVHPTWEPTEISIALGLEANFAHRVGEPRKTPAGTPDSGEYARSIQLPAAKASYTSFLNETRMRPRSFSVCSIRM